VLCGHTALPNKLVTSSAGCYTSGVRQPNDPEPPQPQITVLPWWGERWYKPFFILFLVTWITGLAFPWLGPPRVSYWTAILVTVALPSTLTALGRQLPFQNVCCIALIVGAASALWTTIIESWFDWRMATLWTVIVLSARGSAQFLMRDRRNARFYGWGVFGIAGAIAGLFGAILYNDWVRIVMVPFATVLLLLVSLPLFVDKRPVQPPVSPQPLVVSIALLVWLMIHAAA
jgi:hypothetical protein